MALGLYLELKSHRSRQDAPVYPHMAPTRAPSPYSTPRAESTAYNSTIPPLPVLPPTQSLSSAIDGYINWMSCNGMAVPNEKFSPYAQFDNRMSPTSISLTRRKIPSGILRPPRPTRPLSKGKQVRWRDHEKNKKPMGCLPNSCVGTSSLVEVYDESFKDGRFNHAQRPQSMGRDDPILSYREKGMSRQEQYTHYGPAIPLKRAPSPHPVAAHRLQSGSSAVPMRRTSSPHPHKINQSGRPVLMNSTSRGRSASPVPPLMPRGRSSSPVPPLMPRVRSASPVPGGGRLQGNPDRRRPSPSPQRMRPPQDRNAAPVTTGSFPGRSGTPPTYRGPHQQQRSSSQQWPPPQNQGNSTIVPPQGRGRGGARPERAELKRYAELPGREEKRYAELPGRDENRNAGNYAEIVWKSKEKPIEDPPEEKKRGWKLIRKSGSMRKQQPQPESPQFRRTGQEDDEVWIANANSSVSEKYDRYNPTVVD